MGYKHLRVLVSGNDLPKCAVKILRNNFTVLETRFMNSGDSLKRNYEELLSLIPGCSALLWTSLAPITSELLDRAGPQLRIVSALSDGYDHCNLQELKTRGIQLTNAARISNAAVAETSVGLMTAAARRFTEHIEKVRSGLWELGFNTELGFELRGSTVGIIGLGGIGQAIVKRLGGFEIGKFIYTDREKKQDDTALGAQLVSLDELLTQSDFVILCVPLTKETEHIINRGTLAKMKKNSILVNIARGGLIDQDALYETLKNKAIFGAAVDVTTPEPLPKDHKLLTLTNIFVLPHIASRSMRTRNAMAALAANNIVNALQGKPVITPVHF